VDITSLDHPDHSFRDLFWLPQSTDWNPWRVRQPTCDVWCQRQGRNNLLADNSAEAPGSIFVSSIKAGATPFTVMPFFAYAPANQCTKPCNADLEDLGNIKHVSSERD
jgi:hypothetical protein